MLNIEKSENVYYIHRDIDLLFATSRDIQNVVKSLMKGLPDRYDGRCTLVINDVNFIVVAYNAILLFVALSLEPEEAVTILIHVWYSALLPHDMIDTLRHMETSTSNVIQCIYRADQIISIFSNEHQVLKCKEPIYPPAPVMSPV
jgi:hypothetical protein